MLVRNTIRFNNCNTNIKSLLLKNCMSQSLNLELPYWNRSLLRVIIGSETCNLLSKEFVIENTTVGASNNSTRIASEAIITSPQQKK